jgi:LacI family transcriptional regulator, galactose operon repressor
MPVTLVEVAARAGVSPATVSRVLNGNYPVAESTRQRVQQAVRELDYVVNAHARALLHSTSGIVGVVLNDASDPFFAGIARGIQSAAAETSRLSIICNSEGSPEQEFAFLDMLRGHRADAVVLVGAAPEDEEYREQATTRANGLRTHGTRLVLCGRPSPSEGAPGDVVAIDNEGGSAAITQHLIGRGHRHIAYLTGPEGRTTTTTRLAGFRSAMAEAGVAVDESLVVHGDFSRGSGLAAVEALLSDQRRFTAVLAANDLVAAGAVTALRTAGLRVPEDVSVAGYDDLPTAVDVWPNLTTVHVPLEEIGRKAIELAFGGTGTHTSVMVPTHVVVRESVAPPAAR